MSEQGLREALQRLVDQDEPVDPEEIRELLSDRPAEIHPLVDEKAIVKVIKRHRLLNIAHTTVAREVLAHEIMLLLTGSAK